MASRKHCTLRTTLSTMGLERLEPRLPRAGNVTAELTGSTLRLMGDDLANDVVVASAAGGRIAVIGIDTTINSGTAAFVTTRAITSIVANFNGGDDAVGFGNSAADYAWQRQFAAVALWPVVWSDAPPAAPFDVVAVQAKIDEVAGGVTAFSIPGSLTVATGDSNDSVGISGSLGGSVGVNLGSAAVGNGLVIGSEVSASRVGGSVAVVGGGQNDIVAIGNVSVAGMVSAALGDGINWMVIGGDAKTPTTIGALTYRGGVSMDVVGVAGDVTVRNDVRIVTGARGEDSVGFSTSDAGGTVKVLGNVVVNTGTGTGDDSVSLVGDIRENVSVTTGGGRDTVCVSSSVEWVSTDGSDPVPTFENAGPSAIGRDLVIKSGAGSDLISIGAANVGRNVRLDAGTGHDVVRIEGMQVNRNLFIDLGRGDDSLRVTNLRAFAAYAYGGSGTNSLSTDTATRSASRTLRHYQFQVVPSG